MLRRLFLLLFVIANLSTQASAAFACASFGGTLMRADDCPLHAEPSAAAPAGQPHDCCEPVLGVFLPAIEVAAGAPQLPDVPELPLLLLALAWPEPTQRPDPGPQLLAPPPPQPAPVYLKTQRLRL